MNTAPVCYAVYEAYKIVWISFYWFNDQWNGFATTKYQYMPNNELINLIKTFSKARNYHSLTNPINMMELHEILIEGMPTKIYLDVENNIECTSIDELIQLDWCIYWFCSVLVQIFNSWLNDVRCVLSVDDLVSTCSIFKRPNGTFKYSRHIIVSQIPLLNIKQVKQLIKDTLQTYDPTDIIHKIIDLGVYNHKWSFRLPLCGKIKQNTEIDSYDYTNSYQTIHYPDLNFSYENYKQNKIIINPINEINRYGSSINQIDSIDFNWYLIQEARWGI